MHAGRAAAVPVHPRKVPRHGTCSSAFVLAPPGGAGRPASRRGTPAWGRWGGGGEGGREGGGEGGGGVCAQYLHGFRHSCLPCVADGAVCCVGVCMCVPACVCVRAGTRNTMVKAHKSKFREEFPLGDPLALSRNLPARRCWCFALTKGGRVQSGEKPRQHA